MLKFLGMPIQASAHAAEIDQMTVLVHWLMAVLFVGWGVFFLFVIFRFRKGSNPRASSTGAKGKISKGIEVAIAVITGIVLVFYAIPAWTSHSTRLPSEIETEVVRAVCNQLGCNIHYTAPGGRIRSIGI